MIHGGTVRTAMGVTGLVFAAATAGCAGTADQPAPPRRTPTAPAASPSPSPSPTPRVSHPEVNLDTLGNFIEDHLTGYPGRQFSYDYDRGSGVVLVKTDLAPSAASRRGAGVLCRVIVAWRDTVLLVRDSREVTVRVVARNGSQLASVNPATETCDS